MTQDEADRQLYNSIILAADGAAEVRQEWLDGASETMLSIFHAAIRNKGLEIRFI